MSERRAPGDHLRDVLAGELRELVAAAGLTRQQEPDDERAVLLEEEHVPRLLVVHVTTEDAERRLVIAGVVARHRIGAAPPGGGLLHEAGDVVVEERQRLLDLRTHRLRPGPRARLAGHDQALDDEPIGGFDQQDVLHPTLVEECADRAEDFLEVLPRAALIDAHAAPASKGPVGSVARLAPPWRSTAHAGDPQARRVYRPAVARAISGALRARLVIA